MNDYVQELAETFLGDNPDPQLAADIVDNCYFGSEVGECMAKAMDADVSVNAVFDAWDRAGRPDYSQYLPCDYNDRGPDYRREQTAEARVEAVASLVEYALVERVIALVEDRDWEAVPCEKYEGQPGWFTDAGHLFGLETRSAYLVPQCRRMRDHE